MAQTIGANVNSLAAQLNSAMARSRLTVSVARLSSGLRINSAKDDATGLTVSERFTAQIRGLSQAAPNANDAISLAQTAEGALGGVGENFQRIRELTVQSAKSTDSASGRAARQSQAAQPIAEVQHIGTQTDFTGIKLLDGSFTAGNFQLGANVISIGNGVGAEINLALGASACTVSNNRANAVTTGAVSLSSTRGTILTANANADVFARAGVNMNAITPLTAVGIATMADASAALSAIDEKVSQGNGGPVDQGAIQHRFTSTISIAIAQTGQPTHQRVAQPHSGCRPRPKPRICCGPTKCRGWSCRCSRADTAMSRWGPAEKSLGRTIEIDCQPVSNDQARAPRQMHRCRRPSIPTSRR